MKCPYCSTGLFTRKFWRCWNFKDPEDATTSTRNVSGYEVAAGECPDCEKTILLLRRGTGNVTQTYRGYRSFELKTREEEQILFPRYSRTIAEPGVPDTYRKEFIEASSVLQLSPKASAALSRRLLQSILREEYGVEHKSLAHEIDAFIQRGDVPPNLAKQIDAVRNVGNFAAHPLKDVNTGLIVEVEPEEAEWLLDTLNDLLDFAFVRPRKLEERIKGLNEKLESAGKPPLKE